MTPIQLIAQRLNLREKQVEQTIALLDEGATIPFISRYRKEATGGLDEVAVAAVAEQHRQLDELEHRKAFVLETIEAQGALTDELRARITACWDATEIEDIYLPFKPKRRTRAQMAREKGLEPLAQRLLLRPNSDPEQEAEGFLTDEGRRRGDGGERRFDGDDSLCRNAHQGGASHRLHRTRFAR